MMRHDGSPRHLAYSRTLSYTKPVSGAHQAAALRRSVSWSSASRAIQKALTITCRRQRRRFLHTIGYIPDCDTIVIPSSHIDTSPMMGCNSRSQNQLIVSFPPADAFVLLVELLYLNLAATQTSPRAVVPYLSVAVRSTTEDETIRRS